MRVILHNTLSISLARGLSAVLGEIGMDKISHIDIEYSDYLGTDRWRDFVRSDGWAVLTGSMWTKWDLDELEDWRDLDVPVVFLPQLVMASQREKRAGLILLHWEEIRKALMRGGLHIIKGKDVVPVNVTTATQAPAGYNAGNIVKSHKIKVRSQRNGQKTLL